MQGHKSSLTTLPENISFDHGSSSSDPTIESQIPWSNIQAETNIQYLHHVRHEGLNAEWNMQSRASLNLEQPSNILSFDNVDVNADNNHLENGLQISGSNVLPQDLNMRSGYGYHEDDDCQVVEPPTTYISMGASSEHIPSNNSSYVMDESQDHASCHLDGRRSCKRKAIEGNVGQSSSGAGGSSNYFDHSERSQWHAVPCPPAQIAATTSTENGLVGPASPFSLTTRGSSDSVRRNFRLRINGAHHQDHIPDPDPSASVRNRLLDLNPVENGTPNGQSMPLNVPSMRRNHQTRWNRGSSSRTNNSSASPTLHEEPLTRNIPRSISEHPMFVPASEIGSSSRQNNNLVGGSNNVVGNIASSSRAGPNSPSPNWANRACPQYPRRLSEIVRRSLLSSAGSEVAGQSRNHGVRSQEMGVASGQARSNSRAALLERHLDAAIPTIPYSLRTLAAAGGEGRSNIMSEIRHVLDLMRRGEGLRLEDVMMLDHSVLFGMADIHDRHRDMRLDVDNMSYEELLALGDRIGNVCTGLTEETIMSRLKLKKYVVNKAEDQVEVEPCSICREEYNDGEDVGRLECGHDFHKECIKEWLLQKNLCPICKTTGLTM